MFKKATSRFKAFAVAIAVLLSCMPTMPAQADSYTLLEVNKTVEGNINSGQYIWYDLIVPSDGNISFKLTALKQYFYIDMYLCNEEMYQHNKSTNSHDQWIVSDFAIGESADPAEMTFDHLRSGKYYVLLRGWPSDFPGVIDTSGYSLSCLFTSAPLNSDPEPNDTFDKAVPIEINYTGTGHISYAEAYDSYKEPNRDDDDWYKITTIARGTLDLTFQAIPGQYADIYTLKVYNSEFSNETDYFSLDYTGSPGTITKRKLENLAPGTYYIKLTGWSHYFSSYTMSVAFTAQPVPAASISLPESQTTYVGAKFSLNPVITPADCSDTALTWSSSNTNVAAVDQNGNITAAGKGTTVITVKTSNGKTDTCKLTVNAAVKVTGIKLNTYTASLEGGKTLQLTATVSPSTASNKTVVWTSGNSSVATVSANGLVKAVGAGTTDITAAAADGSGIKAVLKITVTGMTASPTKSAVLVNGVNTPFEAYNIAGANYFKLRDIAYALNGTKKQFEIGWDGVNNAISLTSGSAYTPVGGEMAVSGNTQKMTAKSTTSKMFLNGNQISLTAYLINGNNYFKLRDIATVMNFGLGWDGLTNTISIDTNADYVAP